jgi:ribonuclease HI
LIWALIIAKSMNLPVPIIYTDSAVVFNQVEHKWKCSSPNLKTLLMTVEMLRENYQFKIEKVDRKHVWEADKLCNEYLDKLETYKERDVIHD